MVSEQICYYKKINKIHLLIILIAISLRLFLIFTHKLSFYLVFDLIFYGIIIFWGIIDLFIKYNKPYLTLKSEQIIIKNNIFDSQIYNIDEIDCFKICNDKYFTIILKRNKNNIGIKLSILRNIKLYQIKQDINLLYKATPLLEEKEAKTRPS